MHPRWIVLGGVLVLGLVAVGTWQFLFAPPRTPVGSEAVEQDDAVPEEPPKPDPIGVERRSPVPAGEPAPTPDRPRSTRPPPQTDWIVAGKLHGLHPDVEWTSALVVVCQPEPPRPTRAERRYRRRLPMPVTLRVRLDAAGNFRFGLSELDSLDGTTALLIRADDPNYMPAQTLVELPLVRGKLRGVPQTLTAELTTSPAGLITGKVVGRIGTRVAVFPPPSEDRRPVPVDLPRETAEALEVLGYTDGHAPLVLPLDQTTTDRNGKYTLRIGESGNYVVVALGSPRPCLKHCPGTVFGASTAPDITAADFGEGGPSIEGQVIASFGPVAGARIHAVRRNFPGPLLALEDKVLHYSQGRLEYKNISTDSEEDGTFTLEGLGRAEYDLELTEMPIACAHPDLKDRLQQVVAAPATGVVFDLTGTFVVFRVRNTPWVPTPAKITASHGSASCTGETDDHGEAAMFLAPGEIYEVHVERPPFLPADTSFRLPEDAQRQVQVIDLDLPPPGKLKLVLQGPDPWPVRARVVLESEWGLAFDKEGEVRLEGGETVIRDLTPGGYQVRFVPLAGLAPGPWLLQETEVVIHENATTTETITVQPGGFLEVEIAGAQATENRGVSLSVSRGGTVIPLIERPGQPGEQFPSLLLRDGVHRLVSPLPAGTVQVNVWGDSRRRQDLPPMSVYPQSQDAVIVPGETTHLSFLLEAVSPGDGRNP